MKRRKIVEEIMDILNCKYNKNQVGLFVWGRLPDKILIVRHLLINCSIMLMCLSHRASFLASRVKDIFVFHYAATREN